MFTYYYVLSTYVSLFTSWTIKQSEARQEKQPVFDLKQSVENYAKL